MATFAKRRDSDNLVVGLFSSDPRSEIGFTVEDTTFRFSSEFATETWRFDSANTYTKISDYREAEDYSPKEDSRSGIIQLDFQRDSFFRNKLILTGNVTFNEPLNSQTTQKALLWFIEDGVGGHTINFDSNFFKLKPSTVFDTAANDRNLIEFTQDGGVFYETFFSKGWV